VPPVADLHRFGEGLEDPLAIGAGAVAADVFGPGMLAQPRDQGLGGAVRQDVDPLAGLGVDDHGGVAVPALEGEVIDAEHAQRQDRPAHEHAQGGRAGDRASRHAGEAGARPAR